MNNELFIARSIDELPKETKEFFVPCEARTEEVLSELDGLPFTYHSVIAPVRPKHFLKSITIEQLIAEHPEVVEKIFEAAREMIRHPELKTVIKPTYKTFQDYINSLKG